VDAAYVLGLVDYLKTTPSEEAPYPIMETGRPVAPSGRYSISPALFRW
jgi:hypothetical protein